MGGYNSNTGVFNWGNHVGTSNPIYEDRNLSNIFGLLNRDVIGSSNVLNATGQQYLTSIGFDKNLISNEGFQNYLANQNIYSFAPDTQGLNVISGLDANKIQELQKNYTDGITKGLIDSKTGMSIGGNQNGQSMFDWGVNKEGQTTWGGGTGLQWIGAGLGTATSLYGMYNANKSMKLAQQNFNEQRALNHANYEMQAKAYNNNLRNQQSGRSFNGMSGSVKRTLGREYESRRAREQY